MPWATANAQTTTITSAETDKLSLSGDDDLLVTENGSLLTGDDKAVTIKSPSSVSITVNQGGKISSEDDAITTKT